MYGAPPPLFVFLEESTHVKTEGHLDVLDPSFTVLLYVARSHTPEDIMLIQVLFFLFLVPVSSRLGISISPCGMCYTHN
jgi:hypothetical protein